MSQRSTSLLTEINGIVTETSLVTFAAQKNILLPLATAVGTVLLEMSIVTGVESYSYPSFASVFAIQIVEHTIKMGKKQRLTNKKSPPLHLSE